MKKLILTMSGMILFACNTPYSSEKFQEILSSAKLQAPTSKFDPLYSTKYGELEDVCHKYFYLQDNKYMAFFMCEKNRKKHKRSELRFKKEFKVSSSTGHILKARLKIFPLNEKNEFTFLQIHADGREENTPNKPLLRIVWMKENNGLKDHLWAVIKLNGKKSYKKINLGKRPKNFFNIIVKVKDSVLTIINNEKKVDFDVSYWKGYSNYFKVGVYLQDKGCAKVLFDKLEIK